MSAPERIWVDDDGYWSAFDPSEIRTVIGQYILATPSALAQSPEVAALIQAAVEAAAKAAHDQILNYPLRTMMTDKNHADRVANAVRASAKLEARVTTLNYCRAEGETIQEMRVNLQRNPLGKALINMGDCKLVWANEGDLCAMQAAAIRTPDAPASADAGRTG